MGNNYQVNFIWDENRNCWFDFKYSRRKTMIMKLKCARVMRVAYISVCFWDFGGQNFICDFY